MNARLDPLDADPLTTLDDFAPSTVTKPRKTDEIDKIAADQGFPSRQAPKAPKRLAEPVVAVRSPRRYTTGRNVQISIKATPETITRFYETADRLGVQLGEVLDQAVIALNKQLDAK